MSLENRNIKASVKGNSFKFTSDRQEFQGDDSPLVNGGIWGDFVWWLKLRADCRVRVLPSTVLLALCSARWGSTAPAPMPSGRPPELRPLSKAAGPTDGPRPSQEF